jgi:hypothetical protein
MAALLPIVILLLGGMMPLIGAALRRQECPPSVLRPLHGRYAWVGCPATAA